MPSDNKKIAKNTLFLYFRMFITMGVALYTSRVVLNVLGVSDFGIYNVVGGIVVMLAFLNGALSNSTQRFLSYEIGVGNKEKINEVFNISMGIHLALAILILIISETIGLWFINHKLNFPAERTFAVNCVYQFSIITTVTNILSIPYNALIIAHERMKIYAYISFTEVSLKLIIVILLIWVNFDKLILYSFMMLTIQFIIRYIYSYYCKKHYEESKFKLIKDKQRYKKMASFAGWSFWGAAASMGNTEGINVILNLFFGTTINAARGIAFQVQNAVVQFVSNFQLAINPQIVKSYASSDLKQMHKLIFKGSLFSFIILLIIAQPIIIEMPYILKLWLKNFPGQSVLFCQLVLINSLIVSISGPLSMAAQATGNIKKYQLTMGTLLLLNMPLTYLFFKFNYEPQTAFYICILIEVFALFIRLLMLQKMIKLSFPNFFKNVLLKLLIISAFSSAITLLTKMAFQESLICFLSVCTVSFISIILPSYFGLLSIHEREYVNGKLIGIFKAFRQWNR